MFDLVQILYWLGLSTWFGGVLFIAIAAPIVVRAVRESNPVMTSVLSVNLEGQHGTLLAGSIIGISLIVLARHGRSVPIPFGPFLALGGIAALFFGQQLAGFYLAS